MWYFLKLIYALLSNSGLNPFNCLTLMGEKIEKQDLISQVSIFRGLSPSPKPSHYYLSCTKQLQSAHGWNVSSENLLTMSSDLNIYTTLLSEATLSFMSCEGHPKGKTISSVSLSDNVRRTIWLYFSPSTSKGQTQGKKWQDPKKN